MPVPRCSGLAEQPCIFNVHNPGYAAQGRHAGRCEFCNMEEMRQRCRDMRTKKLMVAHLQALASCEQAQHIAASRLDQAVLYVAREDGSHPHVSDQEEDRQNSPVGRKRHMSPAVRTEAAGLTAGARAAEPASGAEEAPPRTGAMAPVTNDAAEDPELLHSASGLFLPQLVLRDMTQKAQVFAWNRENSDVILVTREEKKEIRRDRAIMSRFTESHLAIIPSAAEVQSYMGQHYHIFKEPYHHSAVRALVEAQQHWKTNSVKAIAKIRQVGMELYFLGGTKAMLCAYYSVHAIFCSATFWVSDCADARERAVLVTMTTRNIDFLWAGIGPWEA